ncbi:T9SS type A sorting domain-containing protein [uncultured Psychroserpens sp.]|uniref:T9SS type A sorting domain-containing protein n=1 Tax=uncultured Psychroserpens sp. TaxID=255436 RepID=UPI002630A8E6|nr:T9SS type A sorting domain-containing protein [uncultured Psychroserpens sp.]
MKKITLLFLALIAFNFTNAQDTCATAVAVSADVTVTVAGVDGSDIPTPECAANAADPDPRTAGEWYTFTASVDGIANITSDLPGSAGGDTRLHIYEGACGSLTCIGGNDDINGAAVGGNYLSDATFLVSSGVTYTFAWDDRWSAGGFDFILTETAVDCSTDSPYSYDFADINPLIACYTIENVDADATTWGYNNGNDFDGDAMDDGVGLIFPQAAGVAKDDWLYLPVFNGVADAEYTFTVMYNVFNNPAPAAEESFDIVVLDSPSSAAASQSVLGTYSGITQAGDLASLIQNAYTSTVSYTPTADGDFYFAIHSTTPAANSGIIILFDIAVDATLGVEDFETNAFTHSYNKTTDVLTLESSGQSFDNITIYNILGQQVIDKQLSLTEETVQMSSLKDGVYLAKVTIEGQSKTLKLLKQ